MSTQVLTTRANGPPEQQDKDRRQWTTGTHTSTALGKTDDRVLSASIEEVGAALGRIDTNEADVLGISRFRVAVQDVPTRSGSDITQSVGSLSVLMKLSSTEMWGTTRGTYNDKVRPGSIRSITSFVRAGARGAGLGPIVGCNGEGGKKSEKDRIEKHVDDGGCEN